MESVATVLEHGRNWARLLFIDEVFDMCASNILVVAGVGAWCRHVGTQQAFRGHE